MSMFSRVPYKRSQFNDLRVQGLLAFQEDQHRVPGQNWAHLFQVDPDGNFHIQCNNGVLTVGGGTAPPDGNLSAVRLEGQGGIVGTDGQASGGGDIEIFGGVAGYGTTTNRAGGGVIIRGAAGATTASGASGGGGDISIIGGSTVDATSGSLTLGTGDATGAGATSANLIIQPGNANGGGGSTGGNLVIRGSNATGGTPGDITMQMGAGTGVGKFLLTGAAYAQDYAGVTFNSSTTLTAADLYSGYILVTGGGVTTLTLPLGVTMSVALTSFQDGEGFLVYIHGDVPGDITIGPNTGFTLVNPITTATITGTAVGFNGILMLVRRESAANTWSARAISIVAD